MAVKKKPVETPVEIDEREVIDGQLSARQIEAELLLQGPQRYTLFVGGSRSSKTTALVRAIIRRAANAPGSRHAILRHRLTDIRKSIWNETLPFALKTFAPWFQFSMNKTDMICKFVNGSSIVLGGLDDIARVEKILGQEYATIYLNECSQIGYSVVGIALTRLAQKVAHLKGGYLKPRFYCDLNPTGTQHWTYQLFIKGVDPEKKAPLKNKDDYGHIFLHPQDNAHNLPPGYIEEILEELPERQRARFLEGKYQNQIDGALWALERIEMSRVNPEDVPPMARIVVAVDPSGAAGKEDKRSDMIGIVAAGIGIDGRAYILADLTVRDGPAGWGHRAVMAYAELRADTIVAEINYGGAMVEFVIETAAKELKLTVPCKTITASRGKHIRAEPISVLYERDKVRHVGRFPDLEDEMTNMSVSGYQGSKSPNRLDAMVWALTELMLGGEDGAFGSV